MGDDVSVGSVERLPELRAGRREWTALGVLLLPVLLISVDATVLSFAVPHLSEGLAPTGNQLLWIVDIYSFMLAGLLVTMGTLGDRIGRRRLLLIGAVGFGFASAVAAYSTSPEMLIFARALLGFAGATLMPSTLSLLRNIFLDQRQRTLAIAIWATLFSVGSALGPVICGWLLEHFWWGSVFLVNVPIVLLGLVLMAVLVPESRNENPGRLDPIGVLLSIVGLVLLVYGIIGAGERSSLADPDVYGSILAGTAVLAVFTVHEARTDHPAFNVRLFRNPRLSVAIVAIMMMFFAMAGVLFFMTFYWQSVREFTPLHAGLLVLPIAAAQLIIAPLSPYMVARFGPKVVAAAGVFLASMALGSYALLDTDTPVWMVELAFFVQGTGMAMVMVPATELVMASVPRHQAGAASAVQNTVRQVATALGVAVLGAVISTVYRSGIDPYLAGLPEGMRVSGGESIEGTMTIVEELGAEGDFLVAPAKEAFLSGMHLAALCSLAIGLLCMVIVLIWLPWHSARSDEQGAPSAGDGHSGGEDGTRPQERRRGHPIATGPSE
jgi:EmrB/QacA subfamily drug resistance transporter